MKPQPNFVWNVTHFRKNWMKLKRRLKQLEIEREAIKREKDEAKLAQLNKEIAELKEQETSYKAKWQSEKRTGEQDSAEQEGNRTAEI